MKLAFALFVYFPYGGLTRDMTAIAQVCRLRGHQVRVYAEACRGEHGLNSIREAGIEVQFLPVKARTNHTKARKFAERLKSTVAEFLPDLLVGFNKMPGLDVYYAADNCFAEKSRNHGWWYQMTPRYRQFLAFEKAVFSRQSCTDILLISKPQMLTYCNLYRLPESRMTLLPPGISRDRIASDNAPELRKNFRAHWQLKDHDILLLSIGSGFHTKGLDRTLKALASLPPHWASKTKLFVLGEDKVAPFERISKRLGIRSRVQFLRGRDDVPAFLLGADLFIHPAYREAAGMVLLEAMVAGLPVITTDVCGHAHYIRDEKMGEVLASPFTQFSLNQSLLSMLEAGTNNWRTRGYNFARKADIYDLPLHACHQFEKIFATRKANCLLQYDDSAS